MTYSTNTKLKIAWFAISLTLNIAALIKDPRLERYVSLLLVFIFPALWVWEWRSKLEARAKIYDLASRLPAMTEEEREQALTAIAKYSVTLRFKPINIAKLFNLID